MPIEQKIIFIILDGWGIPRDKSVSAIDLAKTPYVDSLTQYPHAQLEASGLAVGLPNGQMGNSEVGHMNLGAGRVVYQNLTRISMSIDDGSFYKTQTILDFYQKCKQDSGRLHLMGLVSDGGVHSDITHLKALLRMAGEVDIPNVYIHAFTDGRDVDPMSGAGFVEEISECIGGTNAQLATITGRYYGMDRDKRWERVKIAYDALLHGEGVRTEDPIAVLRSSYEDGVTDEFIKPIIITNEKEMPVGQIQEGDSVLCFNFRTDRGRQISEVLTQNSMPEHGMKKLALHYGTMTEYDQSYTDVEVMFENKDLTSTLGEVLSQRGKKQIRIAETEKYPHVTFFFSGGREEPFENEKRILCPSPKVATYDLAPEMSAYDIRDAIVPEIEKGDADFICLNFANPDMVGHTGVMEAAVRACEVVDECAKSVATTGLANGYASIIIADHGNADCMQNPDGSPHTAHTTQPVPIYIVSNQYKGNVKNGKLADIAPTILRCMGISPSSEMDGDCLLDLT